MGWINSYILLSGDHLYTNSTVYTIAINFTEEFFLDVIRFYWVVIF